jgi:hypothetical protein
VVNVKAKITMTPERVVTKTRKASISNLRQAGAYIRGIARKSIKISPVKSPPGKPPRSRKGRLKDAIVFVVENDAQRVVVGPTATEVGKIGGTHEFGGAEPPKIKKDRKPNWKLEVGGSGPVRNDASGVGFARLKTQAQVERAKQIAPTIQAKQGGAPSNKPRKYPPRPFMGPAFEIAKDRLPKLWAGSVK